MAEVVRTVGPGKNYTSLASFMAGEERTLGVDEVAVAEVYAFQDTSQPLISGFSFAASGSGLIVRPAPGAGAQMPAAASSVAYHLNNTNLFGTLRVDISLAQKAQIQDLQIENSASSTGAPIRPLNVGVAGSVVDVDRCTLVRSGTDVGRWGGVCHGTLGASTVRVRNTFVVGFGAYGIYLGSISAGTVVLYNNTVLGISNLDASPAAIRLTTSSLSNTGTVRVKNNVAQGAGFVHSNVLNNSNFTLDNANNLSGDGSASAWGSSSKTNQTVSFVGAPDYHLASGDTAAKDSGTSLAADAAWPFSDDFDGATRSGTWDIGADELVSAPTTYQLSASDPARGLDAAAATLTVVGPPTSRLRVIRAVDKAGA